MPPAGEYLHFWALIALFAGAITLGLSCARFWLGGCILGLTVFLAIINGFADTSMDEQILKELGKGYLFVRKASGLLPVIAAGIAWRAVAVLRRRFK